MNKTRSYSAQQGIGWLFAGISVVMMIVGALAAFNVIDLRSASTTTTGTTSQDFIDGALVLLPAITMAFIAMTLYMVDSPQHMRGMEATYWKVQQGAVYVWAIIAIVMAVLAIVVGFDSLNRGYAATDGLVWGMMSIATGVLSTGFRMAARHEMVTDDEDIRRMVEDRVGRALQRAGSNLAERGAEHS